MPLEVNEDIDIELQNGGLIAFAENNIYITAAAGDLVLNHIESYEDDVYLTSLTGNIFDNSGNAIFAEDITLTRH